MQVISINGKKFTGPDSWENITTANLLQYALVLECSTLTEKQAKHQLVARFFNIPFRNYRLLPESSKILSHAGIDWLHSPNTLSAWLIGSVHAGETMLFGPDDRLANITGEEFMFCEAAYQKWQQTNDPALMDTVFAVLYRKQGFFNRKRVAFNREKLEKGELKAKKVRRHVKHAVMINYSGCRNLMIQCHPNIWRVAAASATGEPTFTNWAALLLDLAGDKFGTYQETIKTNMWLLLADMDRKAKIARETEVPQP